MVKKARPRPIHFETTIPVIRPCVRCGLWLAAGVAEGIKGEIELRVLEPAEIVWAVLNRLELYVLRRSGLVQMDEHRLAGPSLGRLYPQHRCDVKWPPRTGRFENVGPPADPPY